MDDSVAVVVPTATGEAVVRVEALGERGAVGAQGPAGPVGGYTHTQASPNTVWTINHNLGVKPVISLYTTGGVEFEAQVTHINDNQAVVNLATSIAGSARCS